MTVLKGHTKTATVLFYVSGELRTHNGQALIDIQSDASESEVNDQEGEGEDDAESTSSSESECNNRIPQYQEGEGEDEAAEGPSPSLSLFLLNQVAVSPSFRTGGVSGAYAESPP